MINECCICGASVCLETKFDVNKCYCPECFKSRGEK